MTFAILLVGIRAFFGREGCFFYLHLYTGLHCTWTIERSVYQFCRAFELNAEAHCSLGIHSSVL
jgi:hypothetical protein